MATCLVGSETGSSGDRFQGAYGRPEIGLLPRMRRWTTGPPMGATSPDYRRAGDLKDCWLLAAGPEALRLQAAGQPVAILAAAQHSRPRSRP